MRRRPMRFPRPVGRGVSLGSRTTVFWLSLGFVALPLLLAAPISADPSPTASYTITGISGANNWYRGSAGGSYVVLHWSVQDPGGVVVSTTGCEAFIKINGPTAGAKQTCTAELTGGGSISWTTNAIKIDADPPTGVSASLARGADFNGWYNHPVGISWSGSDATSGIASCASVTYGGPDGAGAAVGGGCTDNAGNTASSPVAISYDGTAPVLSKVAITSGAVADVLRWTSSSASDAAVVQRSARGNKEQPIVFRGTGSSFADKKIQHSLEYTYSVQTSDQAGNASQKISVAALPKVLTLRKLPYVPRASSKPILRWGAVRRATYYHVQLFRGSKRIFAAWPVKNELGLPAAWKWSGHRHRLGPGRYRWYVWAGLGRRTFAHYKTLGSARFIVPRR
jgi:hypothetical protein